MPRKALIIAVIALGPAWAQEDARQIWDNYFGKSRANPELPKSQPAVPQPPKYRRVSQRARGSNPPVRPGSARVAGAALGVTIWEMEPVAPGDGARLLVQTGIGHAKALYTPHRIEADEVLRPNDRVRLGIETPTSGYLYVVDQEMYLDGTLGPPYLIFPVTEARGGDNRVTAGRLVEIPAREDESNVFTIDPKVGSERGEKLTILLTPQPLRGLVLTARAQRLS